MLIENFPFYYNPLSSKKYQIHILSKGENVKTLWTQLYWCKNGSRFYFANQLIF